MILDKFVIVYFLSGLIYIEIRMILDKFVLVYFLIVSIYMDGRMILDKFVLNVDSKCFVFKFVFILVL